MLLPLGKSNDNQTKNHNELESENISLINRQKIVQIAFKMKNATIYAK